jgi:DNA processing protein
VSGNLAAKMAWLRLARTENVGPVTFYQLIETYGGAAQALEKLPELAARGGRKKPLVIPSEATVEKEYNALIKTGGDIITAEDEDYPLPLAALSDAPPVLSFIGDRDLLKKQSVAIVGARNASMNGRKFAESLARDLGEKGCVVTSGLARGIDTAAHVGALPTGTIAVVAGGIDQIYPPENEKLQKQIEKQGLVLAESPLGQQPFAQSFPRRNRIVSGLSAGVVIVEATLKSGSLITARLAGEQGRDVYAVPGHPLDPRAEGPNHLIRDGAILIRHADDVLEHLRGFTGGRTISDSASSRFTHNPVSAGPSLTDNMRETILDNLSPAASPVDDLIRETGLPAALVQAALLELELAGRAQRLPGNRVALIA